MAITFKSVGHFFASVLSKIEATQATVETVSAVAPDSAVTVPVEKVAYAVLGELSAALTAGGAAASSKLADAGLDITVIQSVETLLKSFPELVSIAKTL